MLEIKAEVDKDTILNKIEEVAKLAVKINAAQLEIFYSGHAEKGTGNWFTTNLNQDKVTIANQAFISLEEVIDKVTTEGNFHKSLKITTDTCYSGHWC